MMERALMLRFSRLFAAIAFAGLMFVLSNMAMPLFAPANPPRYFLVINLVLAVVWGWRMTSVRPHRSLVAAASGGITAGVVIAVWALLAHGFVSMIYFSMQGKYHGPVDAVVAAIGLALQLGATLINSTLIATALAGAMVIGGVSGWIGRYLD